MRERKEIEAYLNDIADEKDDKVARTLVEIFLDIRELLQRTEETHFRHYVNDKIEDLTQDPL